MIIFVDVNLREIHAYSDTGVEKIPFHEVDKLTDIVGNQKVDYVTNVMETNVEEVINLVRGISGQKPIARTQRTLAPDLGREAVKETHYLHSTSKGTLLVNDIEMRFEGVADFKIFDEKMKENIKKSPMLRSLIKKGIVKIIGEQKRSEAFAENREDMQKRLAQQSARDRALDDIIMDGKVGDWSGKITGGDMAIEIDVGRRGVAGRGGEDSHGATSMSDLMGMIDGTM